RRHRRAPDGAVRLPPHDPVAVLPAVVAAQAPLRRVPPVRVRHLVRRGPPHRGLPARGRAPLRDDREPVDGCRHHGDMPVHARVPPPDAEVGPVGDLAGGERRYSPRGTTLGAAYSGAGRTRRARSHRGVVSGRSYRGHVHAEGDRGRARRRRRPRPAPQGHRERAGQRRRRVVADRQAGKDSRRAHRQGRLRGDRQRVRRTPRGLLFALTDLLDRQLVFVTGKGGVGKSTIAAALALLAAEQGKRTLVCDLDAKGDLADFYETGPTGFTPREIQPRLYAMSMDTEESLKEYLTLQLKLPRMARIGPLARIFEFVATAAPGVK